MDCALRSLTVVVFRMAFARDTWDTWVVNLGQRRRLDQGFQLSGSMETTTVVAKAWIRIGLVTSASEPEMVLATGAGRASQTSLVGFLDSRRYEGRL